ncbi:cation:proton antiporter [Alkalibacter rhizosphaerae]|uniref:Cation:proton antiporter n=1 Tax=Alkalibacter rhizosphaerae TaxID=2815577 RepID=A0A974XIM7_9FIRM|nr:cation:proton antiporter [Alkalibacter rhizosphaerae]QSX09048.1 cation:proton antiporter [Alkalibacter rhizosphaerae]
MLLSIALILLMGFSLGALLHRIGIPALLGMMAAGMILGPYGLDLFSPEILLISPELRKIALIVILLRGGLSLDLKDLKQVGRPAVLLCFLPALLEMITITLLAPKLFPISTLDAALMGAVVAAVSPAVVVPRMIEMIGNKIGTKKSIPQMILAGASVDDIFVIVVFTSLLTMSTGGETSIGTNVIHVPLAILSGSLIGLSIGWISTLVFRKISVRDTAKVLILLSISFLMVSFEDAFPFIPFSGLLAVMAMGVSMLQSNRNMASRIMGKFSKIWVAAEILLFVLVGGAIDFRYLSDAGLLSMILLAAGLLFRFIGVWLSTSGTILENKEKLFCAIAYMPKATVQAAIGAIPLAMGLEAGNLILTVAVLAIIITAPLGAVGIDRLQRRLLK